MQKYILEKSPLENVFFYYCGANSHPELWPVPWDIPFGTQAFVLYFPSLGEEKLGPQPETQDNLQL